jgi:hypothetical protein
MNKIINGGLAALSLALACTAAAPAFAADRVGVQIGGVGLGFTVGNGHYYDSRHRLQAYTYPSDWKAYHHPQSWYRTHRNWNDKNRSDWYRH